MRGYGEFGKALRRLFRGTHNESFLKETTPELLSCGRLTIEGGNVFTGGHFLLPFWMEWECIINVKKDAKTKSWDMFFFNFLEDTIESFIKSMMMKYIFEVYEENKCSFIYEVSAMFKKEKESLPNPFYEDIGHILEEARQALNNNNIFSSCGLKVKALCEETLQPIQKLYPFKKPFSSLGLGEIKKNVEGNETAEIYGPIFTKIRKALEGIKKEEIKVKNEETITTEGKGKKEINIFPEEKLLDDQIQIRPICSQEEFKKIKKSVRLLLIFLLERNVQSEYIHWVYGFVIFHSWRKETKRLVIDPAETFDDYVSLLNGFGGNEGLWEIERKGKGPNAKHEKENLEFKSLGFSSNLFEAHNLYKKAMEMVEPLKKKENLTIAWQKYPDFMEINSSLVDCWMRESFEGVDYKDINKMLKFFENKDYNYSQAYKAINQKRKEKGEILYWDLPTVRDVIRELLEEREKFKKYLRILENQRGDKKKVLSTDEMEYEELKDLILLITEENKEDKGTEPDILRFQNITFERLIKKPAISSVINIVKGRINKGHFLKHEVAQKIIGPAIEASLWVIIAENRINFNKLTALNDLKNLLIETLAQEIENQIKNRLLSIEFEEPRSRRQFDESN
jgi:hypothetical protein